jgi:hypothetical protein
LRASAPTQSTQTETRASTALERAEIREARPAVGAKLSARVRVIIRCMPYSRRRPRISATGRVSVRLSTRQRDLFLGSRDVPASLVFALKHAPVRDGKLSLRITRSELDHLIATVAKIAPRDKAHERDLNTFLDYLDGLEDRFEETESD